MIDWGKTVIATVVVLTATGGVYADMTPISPVQAGEYEETVLQPVDLSDSLLGPAIIELGASSVVFLPTVDRGVRESHQTQPCVQLSGEQSGSVDLCLYALIGFGLCRSGHWVKKISLGFVPEWYHDGSPYQVGHSRAIEPNLYCSPALCLVQPGHAADDYLSCSCMGASASLWRESQSTPTDFASRGPPAFVSEFVDA